MSNNLFFLYVVICTTASHNIGHLFLATINNSTEIMHLHPVMARENKWERATKNTS